MESLLADDRENSKELSSEKRREKYSLSTTKLCLQSRLSLREERLSTCDGYSGRIHRAPHPIQSLWLIKVCVWNKFGQSDHEVGNQAPGEMKQSINQLSAWTWL